MNRRVEVLPGPGMVVRFGEVIAWAGPQASSSLITFLVDGARNLANDPNGGRLLADHLRGVLVNGDPEPAVPFVTIGPSTAGLDALMHGPVQLWDGVRWHMVSPTPGWLRELLPPTGTVLTGPAGAQPPNLAIGSPLNLITGVVPGGGLAIVAMPTPPPAPAASGATGATTFTPERPAPAEAQSPFAPPQADAPRDVDAQPSEQSAPAQPPLGQPTPEQSPPEQPPGGPPPA